MNYKVFLGLFFVVLLVGSVAAVSDELRQKDALKEQVRLEKQLNDTLKPPIKAVVSDDNALNATDQERDVVLLDDKKGGFLDDIKGLFVRNDAPVVKKQVEEKFLGLFKVERTVSYQGGVRKAGIFDFLFSEAGK